MDIKEARTLGFTNYFEQVEAFDTLENRWSGGNVLQWRRSLLVLSPLCSEQHCYDMKVWIHSSSSQTTADSNHFYSSVIE